MLTDSSPVEGAERASAGADYAEYKKPRLTRESLHGLLASSGVAFNIESRKSYFRKGDRSTKKIKALLRELRESGLVEKGEDRDGKIFRALAPWPDVAYGEVIGPIAKSDKFAVRIANLPEAYPITVTLSKKQISAHDIKAGDKILMHLSRTDDPFHLRARVIEIAQEGKPVTLTGKFTIQNGVPVFKPGNTNIKSAFALCAGSLDDIAHNTNCYATFPLEFDLRSPCVFVSPRQDIVPATGMRIADVLARKHDIDNPFSDEATEESSRLKYRHLPRSGRDDLTDIPFITIDPKDARDHDDMLFAERISGGWRAIVPIADVTEYVHYGSALDREAYRRGNTVYFPKHAYPMLPPDLTEKCSLLPHTDRPVVYGEMFFDDSGKRTGERIGFGVARSHARLSYGEYDDLVYQNDVLVRDLADLHEVLRQRVRLDKDQRIADDLLHPDGTQFIGENTVETFMVQFNEIMLHTLHQNGIPTLYRNNGPTLDLSLYEKTRRSLHELSFDLPENPVQCDERAIKRVFDEAMMRGIGMRIVSLVNSNLIDRAFYDPENRGHFALRLKFYGHGTSPIRRYSDLVVHRGLRTLKGMDYGLQDEEIGDLRSTAAHLNRKKQQSKDIAQDLRRFHAIGDLKHLEKMKVLGILLQVNEEDIEVMLPRSGLRIRISQDQLQEKDFRIDPVRRELVYIGNGQEKRIGRDGKLHGIIHDVNPMEGRWGFEPVMLGLE